MIQPFVTTDAPMLYHGDIPEEFASAVRMAGAVAWDTETTGLDWRTERLCLCQLSARGAPVAVVRIDGTPTRLRALLANESVRKVFHHAMFDLRFMTHTWGVRATNVACTKIASKLLEPAHPGKHTLQSLLRQHLGVEIDKGQRLSDWLAERLTAAQVSYAAKDVSHLVELLEALEAKLEAAGLLGLARGCFAHLPTRVELELRGYGDVFTY
jgi:ribonuclease D